MTAKDPEIAAMEQMNNALAPLDEDVRTRVLEWAGKKYGGALAALAAGNRASAHVDAHRPVAASAPAGAPTAFQHFAELYDAVNPVTDADKALVGAYWVQVCTGEDSFPSRDVNKLLEDQGRAVGNITRAFDVLREQKPALVHQIEKSGKTKQARKKFKVTTEGLKWVRARLNGSGGEHG